MSQAYINGVKKAVPKAQLVFDRFHVQALVSTAVDETLENFSDILDRLQPNVVKEKLQAWLAWASRSRLPAFIRVSRTIREHLDDIVAYIRWRLTNAVVEGLGNKARLATRRAYGFRSRGGSPRGVQRFIEDVNGVGWRRSSRLA